MSEINIIPPKKSIKTSSKNKINLTLLMKSLRATKVYEFVADLGKNKRVMDYGCGPGWGSVIIAKKAKEVVGVDISEGALKYAESQYQLPNLKFIKIDNYPTNFTPESFDIIISSHVIEHIDDVKIYLNQLKRLLKKDGILILTTPNKRFRLLPFQKPYDPYHKREYNYKELKRDLMSVFNRFEIKGIYSPKKIDEIEIRVLRTINNPFIIYFRDPIFLMLEKLFPRKIVNFIKKLETDFINFLKKNKAILTAEFKVENKFSTEDIIIGEDINKSIDFLAICYKA